MREDTVNNVKAFQILSPVQNIFLSVPTTSFQDCSHMFEILFDKDFLCLFPGHFLDQRRLKQGLYRHPWDDITYMMPEHVQNPAPFE